MSETRKYLTKEDVLRELDFEIKQAEYFSESVRDGISVNLLRACRYLILKEEKDACTKAAEDEPRNKAD